MKRPLSRRALLGGAWIITFSAQFAIAVMDLEGAGFALPILQVVTVALALAMLFDDSRGPGLSRWSRLTLVLFAGHTLMLAISLQHVHAIRLLGTSTLSSEAYATISWAGGILRVFVLPVVLLLVSFGWLLRMRHCPVWTMRDVAAVWIASGVLSLLGIINSPDPLLDFRNLGDVWQPAVSFHGPVLLCLASLLLLSGRFRDSARLSKARSG